MGNAGCYRFSERPLNVTSSQLHNSQRRTATNSTWSILEHILFFSGVTVPSIATKMSTVPPTSLPWFATDRVVWPSHSISQYFTHGLEGFACTVSNELNIKGYEKFVYFHPIVLHPMYLNLFALHCPVASLQCIRFAWIRPTGTGPGCVGPGVGGRGAEGPGVEPFRFRLWILAGVCMRPLFLDHSIAAINDKICTMNNGWYQGFCHNFIIELCISFKGLSLHVLVKNAGW